MNLKLNKVIAFIKRDFIIEKSYKMAFFLNIINSLFPVLSFYFIAKLVDGGNAEGLVKYGGDYFAFALIGISFTRYFQLAINTFSGTMRRAQMEGCLEAILSSQTPSDRIVMYSSVYSFLSSGVQLIMMFLFGWLFLNFSFAETNFPALIVTIIFSVLTFISLGILSAAGTIIFKKGEPFGWIFGTISGILGGAIFPIEVMPESLQVVSYIVPITYSLDAIRLSMLQGYSIEMISSQLIILATMGLVLFPLSLYAFKWTINKGKKDGTLLHY